MPQIFSNDIDLVRKDPKPKKKPKQLLPESQPVPAFEPLHIDDYDDHGAPNLPASLDQHDPLALFQLFFSNKMVDKIVHWTNEHAASHPPSDEDAPLGHARP
jgi:hypothetical protein